MNSSINNKDILPTGITRFSVDHEVTVSAKDKLGYQRPVKEITDFTCDELKSKAAAILASDIDFRNKKLIEKIPYDSDSSWVFSDCQKIKAKNNNIKVVYLAILATTNNVSLEQRKRINGMIISISDKSRIIFSEGVDFVETTNDVLVEGPNEFINMEKHLALTPQCHTGTFFNVEKTSQFRVSNDVVRLRVFLEEGIMFLATRKRLWITRSRWNGYTSFYEMYLQAKGPSKEVLFGDGDYLYSSKLFIICVAHEEVTVSSKQIVKVPYTVLEGKHIINRQIKDKDLISKFNPSFLLQQVPKIVTESKMYSPFVINGMDRANKHIQSGFVKHKKDCEEFLSGEAVIYSAPNGVVYKIKSFRYSFGLNLRSSDMYLTGRFGRLCHFSSTMKSEDLPFLKNVKIPKDLLKFYIENAEGPINKSFVKMCSIAIESYDSNIIDHNKRFGDVYDTHVEKINGMLIISNMLFHLNPCYIPKLEDLCSSYLFVGMKFAHEVMFNYERSNNENISIDFAIKEGRHQNSFMKDYIQLLSLIESTLAANENPIENIIKFIDTFNPKVRFSLMNVIRRHFTNTYIEEETNPEQIQD